MDNPRPVRRARTQLLVPRAEDFLAWLRRKLAVYTPDTSTVITVFIGESPHTIDVTTNIDNGIRVDLSDAVAEIAPPHIIASTIFDAVRWCTVVEIQSRTNTTILSSQLSGLMTILVISAVENLTHINSLKFSDFLGKSEWYMILSMIATRKNVVSLDIGPGHGGEWVYSFVPHMIGKGSIMEELTIYGQRAVDPATYLPSILTALETNQTLRVFDVPLVINTDENARRLSRLLRRNRMLRRMNLQFWSTARPHADKIRNMLDRNQGFMETFGAQSHGPSNDYPVDFPDDLSR